MYHNRCHIYCGFDLIEGEIFRQDNRSWKWSIITLFYEHSFCIHIELTMFSLTRKSEDISRKSYIDLTRIDSGNGRDDNDLFSQIENIHRYLSYIHFCIMMIVYFYVCIMRWWMIIMSMMGVVRVLIMVFMIWLRFVCFFCIDPDTKYFWHRIEIMTQTCILEHSKDQNGFCKFYSAINFV